MEYVFVLGDSRTGTTSIHQLLRTAGYRSIHYFFQESGVDDPPHLDMQGNWTKLHAFIEQGVYNAFADYPTRSFFRELMDSYPHAKFILTTRETLEVWRDSMASFFGKFGIGLDIDDLARSHEIVNGKIRQLAEEKGISICEICIDDDPIENSERIRDFLGLCDTVALGWENKTSAYDVRKWSSRVSFFNSETDDFLEYIKRACLPNKAILSEYGWTFLINDSSNFFDYCYGTSRWDDDQISSATRTLKERIKFFHEKGTVYLKFIVPEKCIIYPEYLPKVFRDRRIAAERPAEILCHSCAPNVDYLADVLIDAKSYGALYFRGDSHTNWLGSYFVYVHIVEALNKIIPPSGSRPPVKLSELTPELAAYAGDVWSQLSLEQVKTYKGAWSLVSLGDVNEHLVKYSLSSGSRKATSLVAPDEYAAHLGDRPLLRFENENSDLPKAVIFRDSTADFLVDLLAEHFSSSLFIWHKGLVYEDIIERENPDIVLHIMAERFCTQYTDTQVLSRCLPEAT